jgi:nucleoside-diphosphate-sugar epimerase
VQEVSVLILGCGYTGIRVARRMLDRGEAVVATTRSPAKLAELATRGARIARLDVLEPETLGVLSVTTRSGVRVVHSIPVIDGDEGPFDPTPALLKALGTRPSRIVYLSTTGVYGAQTTVDETTPIAPLTKNDRLRAAAEEAVSAGPWSSLVLRPAAIYGPGRGVQESIRQGRFRLLGDGGNFVSRIHVEDLAALVDAALFSSVEGTFPVADEEPCTSLEMARFCAEVLGVPVPPQVDTHDFHHTRRANRRVDGREILRRLGARLRYPTYRVGVPASLLGA